MTLMGYAPKSQPSQQHRSRPPSSREVVLCASELHSDCPASFRMSRGTQKPRGHRTSVPVPCAPRPPPYPLTMRQRPGQASCEFRW
jgi:hypothetical protein